MDSRVRVLQVTGGWQEKTSGGIASFLFNYFRQIDKSQIVIEILTIAYPNFDLYKDRIEAEGGRLFCLNVRSFGGITGKFRYLNAFRKYLKEHRYDVIHINQGSYFTVLLLSLWARLFGRGAKVISHSHSTLNTYRGISSFTIAITKPLFHFTTDYFLACSKPSGQYMFPRGVVQGNKFSIMNNAIYAREFIFDEDKRRKVRQKLQIEDYLVLGHVGRFSRVKNHSFLLDVFSEIHEQNEKSYLLLIGSGDKDIELSIKRKISSLHLEGHVSLLGTRNDVADFMQAFDVLVLPSFYEGLSVVVIEAQASDLPLVTSEALPDEAVISKSFRRLPLTLPASDWAQEVLDIARNHKRQGDIQSIIDAGYDIEENVSKLENLYRSLARQK